MIYQYKYWHRIDHRKKYVFTAAENNLQNQLQDIVTL